MQATSGAVVPTNPVIEVEFNEALDPATVNSSTVRLMQNVGGAPLVASTVSLVRERVIRIVPDAELLASSNYFFNVMNGVLDLDGQTGNTNPNPNIIIVQITFSTSTVADNVASSTIQTSPPDGAADVGLNALLRLRFGGDVISPLSATGQTLLLSDGVSGDIVPCSISFTDGNREADAKCRWSTAGRQHGQSGARACDTHCAGCGADCE